MFIWLLAFVIVGVVALVGNYQGGIRAAFSLIGLFIAALLARAVGIIPKAILPAFGIKHEVWLTFIPPFIGFVLVLIAFKVAAFMVNRKVEVHYKHRASETVSGLWNRLNQRLGICIGIANGVVYVFLICIVLHIFGYFTIQAATSEEDHWTLRAFNRLNQDMESSGFSEALAPFNPATPFYYDAVDVIGYIFHTPLLQKSLATYPVFLPLADESRFQEMAKDRTFQQFWLQGPTMGTFIANNNINPLVKDPTFYTQIVGLLEGDLTDLKGYLETGVSGKFGEEKILGPWYFSFNASYNMARRNKPNMTLAERKWIRNLLQVGWSNSELTAYLDGTIRLKRRSGKSSSGTWKRAYGNKYEVKFKEGSVSLEMEAIVEPRLMTLSQEKTTFVFKK